MSKKVVSVARLDTLFSKIVRERAEHRCENCNSGHIVQCSHHVSRKFSALRWHPDNAVCHCAKCHRIFTDNPLKHADWIRQFAGVEMYESLKARAVPVTKITSVNRTEIYAALRDAYNFMLQQRREGATGRLEFDSPYEDVREAA